MAVALFLLNVKVEAIVATMIKIITTAIMNDRKVN